MTEKHFEDDHTEACQRIKSKVHTLILLHRLPLPVVQQLQAIETEADRLLQFGRDAERQWNDSFNPPL